MEERIPPQNLDAEKSVLGAAMLSKDALMDVVEVVRPDDFYNNNNREIFSAICKLNQEGSPVDTITVSEELKRRAVLDSVGGRVYVASLAADVPSTSNAVEYARIIAEKATLRRLIEKGGQISEKAFDSDASAGEVLEFAEKEIFDIGQRRQRKDFVHIKDVLVDNIEAIDKASQIEGNLIGITTGFKDLDDKTTGLQNGNMVVVAARPGMGKTAFALSIAQAAAIKGKGTVLIFSMEMTRNDLGQRLLSMDSKVDLQKIKTGDLERRDWDQINLALDELSQADINIDDSSRTMVEIRNKCRRLKAARGLDLVIVDYLQLMNFEGRSEGRQQEITTISRYMKQLAMEMECPVMALSQLSRKPEERPNHRPLLSDLRESGAIEQDADLVLFLYRDDFYNGENSERPGECEVIISKNRSGPVGTVYVTWIGKYTKFADKSGYSK
ncbi:MAG: replicative DNA helicase [Firmicutes bacterium]|nr:replicative DNA helicase [Bacillota bacterium]